MRLRRLFFSRAARRNTTAVVLLLLVRWTYSHQSSPAVAAGVRDAQWWSIGNAATTLQISQGTDGSISATSLRPHGSQREWMAGRGAMFRVEGLSGGKRFVLTGRNPWRLLRVERLNEGESRTLHLQIQSEEVPLIVGLRWHCQPGRGPLEFDYRLGTPDGEPVTITRADSIALPLRLGRSDPVVHWVRKGRPDKHGLAKFREPLAAGQRKTLWCSADLVPTLQSPDESVPWLAVENGDGGCYIGWAFSGHGRFEVNHSGNRLLLGGGLDPETFRHEMRPGEWLPVPACLVGLYQGTLDDGVADLHAFLRDHWVPPVGDDRFPYVQFNTWTALGPDVDDRNVRTQLAAAAALGVESFALDAGWYRTIGDWRPDPRRFPHGLLPLAEQVHGLGLKFGLWMACAQAGPDLVRAHPEWLVDGAQDPARVEFTRFASTPICLGHRPAREWLEQEIDRLVRTTGIDYLVMDQSQIEVCRRADHTHQAGDGNYAATRGLYEVLDWVRVHHPRLIIENCCGGGNMLDYGMLRRTHLSCLSDLYGPPDNRRASYGATYPFPAAICESYMEETRADAREQFRSAMMGLWNLSADTTQWSPARRSVCAAEIARYKSEVRPLLQLGRVRHLVGQAQVQRGPDGLAFEDPRAGQGVLFIFRGSMAARADQHGRMVVAADGSGPGGPLALRPQALYELIPAENGPATVRSGAQLAAEGLPVAFSGRATSEILSWRRLPTVSAIEASP